MRLDGAPAYLPAWKDKVSLLHKTLTTKPMTAKILKYLFNQHFLPSIIYRTYGNALSESNFDKYILKPLLPAIKHRLKLPSTTPNHVIFHSEGYALCHPFQRALAMHLRHLMRVLSLDHPASLILKHHCRLLQTQHRIQEFPLSIAVDIQHNTSTDYILAFNRICAKYRLTVHPHLSLHTFCDTSSTFISALFTLPTTRRSLHASQLRKCTHDNLLRFINDIPATPSHHQYGTRCAKCQCGTDIPPSTTIERSVARSLHLLPDTPIR